MSSTSDSSPSGHPTTYPTTLAGDPFAYAGDKPREPRLGCFACYEGWVYMGFDDEVGDDDVEEEQIERVPCKRCARCRS
jgi:hypothetical protein